MRNWIIGAAAILAVAVPGVAAAQTGYVGAAIGNAETDPGDDADFYGVEGAVAFAGSGSIVFEIDASVTDSDDLDTGYGITGHVYGRSDQGLFGGFVGIGGTDDSETWTAGLEASKFYTNWTLAGALFYANNDDFDADGYGVNVQGRFFVHDNFRLQGNLGWAQADFAGGDTDAFIYGVGAEYQFTAAPISIGASWNHAELDDFDAEADSLVGVIRYNFGGTTLRDRDRNGASQADITGAGFLF
ncbi:MAG TPA: DUF481 domain-containing protein [Vitreimonas sp.]|uniref:DUF481 domain-containing protein n=1 Tax=Vitreimonas sp. TaxID=3069702 RepID=UPI002D53E84A|nr:DUF481 domain-containing protein [Vitreimonas sp.]HYD88772.1 DUF481 domain-containing protein [Vitreimonas sp.]